MGSGRMSRLTRSARSAENAEQWIVISSAASALGALGARQIEDRVGKAWRVCADGEWPHVPSHAERAECGERGAVDRDRLGGLGSRRARRETNRRSCRKGLA